MKSKLAALALLTSFTFSCKTSKNKVYTIIKNSSPRLEQGIIDTASLNSLSEPMKAVAYLYTANAELKTGLQSNNEVSVKQLSLIKKYFPTALVLGKTKGQQRLRTSLTAIRNNYFTSLKLSQDKETITASYAYDTIVDGQILSHSNDDVYVFDGKAIKLIE